MEFVFLFCVIDIFSKYALFVPLKDKKRYQITKVFEKFLDSSNRKPNKIWVDEGSKLCNTSMKLWLQDIDVELYLAHNDQKFVVAERFDRTLKTKIHKCINSISKNIYINKLDEAC